MQANSDDLRLPSKSELQNGIESEFFGESWEILIPIRGGWLIRMIF